MKMHIALLEEMHDASMYAHTGTLYDDYTLLGMGYGVFKPGTNRIGVAARSMHCNQSPFSPFYAGYYASFRHARLLQGARGRAE